MSTQTVSKEVHLVSVQRQTATIIVGLAFVAGVFCGIQGNTKADAASTQGSPATTSVVASASK